jgi:hypothetical protein
MEMHLRGTTARLAAYGAYVVTIGLVAVLGFFVWLTIPVPTGGENIAMGILTWIAGAVVVGILGTAHVVLARQLLVAASTTSG